VTRALTAATAGAALIVAACSPPTTTPTTPDPPSAQPSSAPVPTQAPTASSPASTPTPTQPAGEDPVATRPGSIGKVAVTTQVFPVRRSGGTATVDLYIASRDPEETFMLSDNLGDGNTETASTALTSVDGIRLLDTTAKKAYLAAVTADGACVCSPDDANTMTLNSSVWVTVAFAAPPASVTTVSVAVPAFGTFTDVPVL
jgi:hypothetical protein